MDLKRVSAEEAKKLIDEDGYTLLDVRSVPEFAEAHPEGALNVPFLNKAPHGMVPNKEFSAVVQKLFEDKDTKIITSCQMGGRSSRAARELMTLGYTDVIDMKGGFGSEKDPSGVLLNIGWQESGYPTQTGDPADRSYRAIHDRVMAQPDDCAPATPVAGDEDDAELPRNRFAHPTKTVVCAKIGKRRAALKRKPMGGPLGLRLKQEVSADGWDMWVEHSKMIINEYKLNPADAKSQEMLIGQCEQFFFGEGAALPPDFVPQAAGK